MFWFCFFSYSLNKKKKNIPSSCSSKTLKTSFKRWTCVTIVKQCFFLMLFRPVNLLGSAYTACVRKSCIFPGSLCFNPISALLEHDIAGLLLPWPFCIHVRLNWFTFYGMCFSIQKKETCRNSNILYTIFFTYAWRSLSLNNEGSQTRHKYCVPENPLISASLTLTPVAERLARKLF